MTLGALPGAWWHGGVGSQTSGHIIQSNHVFSLVLHWNRRMWLRNNQVLFDHRVRCFHLMATDLQGLRLRLSILLVLRRVVDLRRWFGIGWMTTGIDIYYFRVVLHCSVVVSVVSFSITTVATLTLPFVITFSLVSACILLTFLPLLTLWFPLVSIGIQMVMTLFIDVVMSFLLFASASAGFFALLVWQFDVCRGRGVHFNTGVFYSITRRRTSFRWTCTSWLSLVLAEHVDLEVGFDVDTRATSANLLMLRL